MKSQFLRTAVPLRRLALCLISVIGCNELSHSPTQLITSMHGGHSVLKIWSRAVQNVLSYLEHTEINK